MTLSDGLHNMWEQTDSSHQRSIAGLTTVSMGQVQSKDVPLPDD